MKKKLVIIGPFGRKGGRQLEAAFIADALKDSYTISLFSTVNVNPDTDLLAFGFKGNIESLNKLVYDTHKGARTTTNLMYSFRKKIRANHFHVSNKLTNALYNLNSIKAKALHRYLAQFDGVLVCAQLHTMHMAAVVESAAAQHIPLLFRTTGSIDGTHPASSSSWLNKVNHFIHHSVNSSEQLVAIDNYEYSIVDQCAFQEDNLLAVPVLSERIKHFLCLGRLDVNKNIATVIAAFKQSASEESTLTIIGDGPEAKHLKELVADDSRITLTPFIANSAIASVFEKAHCLIISSEKESGPLTGIEAMAAGRIVISTAVGAMPERLPDYPFWFDGTTESLVAQMNAVTLLNEEEVGTYANQLRKQYQEKFSKKSISDQYETLLASIVK